MPQQAHVASCMRDAARSVGRVGSGASTGGGGVRACGGGRREGAEVWKARDNLCVFPDLLYGPMVLVVDVVVIFACEECFMGQTETES